MVSGIESQTSKGPATLSGSGAQVDLVDGAIRGSVNHKESRINILARGALATKFSRNEKPTQEQCMSELVSIRPRGYADAMVINLDQVVRIEGHQGGSTVHLTDRSTLILEHVPPSQVAQLPRLTPGRGLG